MKPIQSRYVAALYMRLSKDDGTSESSSIKTQRNMLRSYAKEHGFIVYDEYIDDGWSGTNFERPEFKRMIADVEKKMVNLIITKDLSRLGRDYITAGQYTEIYFPSKGVRYIAINDGFDTDNQYNDIAPFKNVINEMYARDTSKKIRSAFIAKMKEGEYIGNFAPYGYKKDPANKNRLLIDEEVSHVVEQIFKMAYDGYRPTEIANFLNDQKIPTPAMYRCQKYPHLNIDDYTKRKEWTTATISKTLRNIVYIGNMAQKKTTKVSFKTKVTVKNDRSDWIVVENTHEPIISQETFDMVRRRCQSRIQERRKGFVNIFSGIAKCADCGKNMSTVSTRKKVALTNLSCGNYKLYGSSECTNHFIHYHVLYDIVLKSIQEQINLSEAEKKSIALELNETAQALKEKSSNKKEISILNERCAELDKIIEKLYEDNFQGTINDSRFKKLLEKYEKESQTIQDKINFLTEKSSEQENYSKEQSFEKFLALINDYADVQVLTTDLLYKLIDRIEVGQGYFEKTEQGRVKHQTIKIYFRFMGTATVKKCDGTRL